MKKLRMLLAAAACAASLGACSRSITTPEPDARPSSTVAKEPVDPEPVAESGGFGMGGGG